MDSVYFIYSKPEGDFGSLQRGMRKSDSQFSLDWDAALEKARQEALAPDRVPLVSNCLIGLLVTALVPCVGWLL